MQIRTLIDQAKTNSRLTLGEMAQDLQTRPSRISELKSGKWRPEAYEIAYFADKAGLSVFQALAEIEAELHPEMAHLWQKAVRELWKNQGFSRLKKISRNVAKKLQPKQREKRKARKGPFSMVAQRRGVGVSRFLHVDEPGSCAGISPS